MWTHLQPYIDDHLTSQSLARHARVALWRAINLRRLIVMAGSGASASLGYPSWSALGSIFLQATSAELEKARAEWPDGQTPRKLENVILQINRLASGSTESGRLVDVAPAAQPQAGDFTLLMDLCEHLLGLLPAPETGPSQLDSARTVFARQFRAGREALAVQKLRATFGGMPADTASADGAEDPFKHLASIALGGSRPEQAMRVFFDRGGGQALDGDPNQRDPLLCAFPKDRFPQAYDGQDPARSDPSREVVGAIFETLRVSRVMTLNYDLEFERWISNRVDMGIDGIGDAAFAELCACDGRAGASAPEVIVENGLRKAAFSGTLHDGNVGQLINFASYARRFDYQVFHLHGRADAPTQMVLTQADYQRLYLQEAANRQAFEAAQDILFGGNDVLFLGVGMKEEEVLRPLRRFASRRMRPGEAPRRAFVLMPSNHSDKWQEKNDAFALRLHIHFDTGVLHYGGERFRKVLKALDGITEAIKEADPFTLRAELARLRSNAGPAFALLNEPEIDTLAEVLRALEPWGSASSAVDKLRRDAAQAMVAELFSRTTARGLVHEINALREGSDRWWADWRHGPHERRARYRVASEEQAGVRLQTWVRHFAENPPADAAWRWSAIEQAREEALRVMRAYPERKRRILRLTLPRGGGKGALVGQLVQEKIRGRLFARGYEAPVAYRAAFVAHLSFSMEFNSVLKALSRFLARQVAQILVERMDDALQSGRLGALAWTGAGWRFADAAFKGDEADLELRQVAEGVAAISRELAGKVRSNRAGELGRRIRDTLAEMNAVCGPVSRKAAGQPPDETPPTKDERRKRRELEALRRQRRLLESVEAVSCTGKDQAIRFGRGGHSRTTLWEVAMRIYVMRREDEPRLLQVPRAPIRQDLQPVTPRDHRLDVLRSVMAMHERVAQGDADRLFICLSGLERITDASGDGYNPAHRALFRLLVGQEETRLPADAPFSARVMDRAEPPIDPPFDLVLIAGRPDVPINYLSERLPDDVAIPAGQRQHYTDRSRTGRLLRKWPALAAPTWEERAALAATAWRETVSPAELLSDQIGADGRRRLKSLLAIEDLRMQRLLRFVKWASETDSATQRHDLEAPDPPHDLHRLLVQNVSLSILVMVQWASWPRAADESDAPSAKAPSSEMAGLAVQKAAFERYCAMLDRAAARDGAGGVFDAVLALYRRHDRRASDGAAIEGCAQGDGFEQPSEDAELCELILRHLTLFALPVEPWVLLGCPLIERRIDVLTEARRKALALPPTVIAHEHRYARLAWQRWIDRALRLEKLKRALDVLRSRGLLLRIQPSSESGAETGQSSEAFLHTRFSIHARLREQLSHKMRLSVVDDGDRNHHGMSIFCDQPRDLPTPSAEHFGMVREIIETQIDACRQALWSAYQTGRAGDALKRETWDAHGSSAPSDAAPRAVARRVFAPDPSKLDAGVFEAWLDEICEREWMLGSTGEPGALAANGIAGSLGRFNAVPQRLRGCYSLLQGGFSIGALSRLDNVERAGDENSPFDSYRSWLRSLLNAAAGLERNRQEIGDVLAGRVLAGHARDRPSPMTAAHGADAVERENRVRKAASDDLFFGPRQESTHTALRHPFYRDEIAWLYNERGLTSLVQGHIFDALPLLRRAEFVMSHKRTPTSDQNAYHAAERRIRINYAIAQLERGGIAEARRLLEDLHDTGDHIPGSTPSRTRSFARLYLALCDHLTGSLQRARMGYDIALEAFVEGKQLRTVAIANRHLGDLMRRLGDAEGAVKRAELAVSAAAQAEQRDEQNMAMVSLARMMIDVGNLDRAKGLIARARSYAEQMNLARLQAEALAAEGELMLARGDRAIAGQLASEAIAVTVRHGMRLRKLTALTLFAKTRLGGDSHDLGLSILEEAKAEAERLGYQTLAARAGDLLSEAI